MLDLPSPALATMPGLPTLDELRHLIRTHPIVDNHAHNILRQQHAINYEKYPLNHIVSESSGLSLQSVVKKLSYHRAIEQLSELFDCEPNWEAIIATRTEQVKLNYPSLVRRCLAGTDVLLLDDLLQDDNLSPYSWHNQFTSHPNKRIVRVETIAAELLQKLSSGLSSSIAQSSLHEALASFERSFRHCMQDELDDDDVVGFKSVICYRAGLNIDLAICDDPDVVLASFTRLIRKGGNFRVDDKAFNDWLLLTTLQCINPTRNQHGKSKPIQLHTGYGDSDISLVYSNPAYLQPLIEKFPDIDFILLHSAYPYTREAGYLAEVYANVYLDLSLVFPMASRDGQDAILRDSLILTPSSKLLWSTDGHSHPEGFWLANRQFREMLEKVRPISLLIYHQLSDFPHISSQTPNYTRGANMFEIGSH